MSTAAPLVSVQDLAINIAVKLRIIIETMHKQVGDRVYDLRCEAERILPIASTEPADPVYTLSITPSTEAAREYIAKAVDADPMKLRATFDQARDIARDLDASIVLLTGAGRRAGYIGRDGDYALERP